MSVGATRDLEEANSLAKQMVEQYGMGGSNATNVYFRTDLRSMNAGGIFSASISDKTKSLMEMEAYQLIRDAYQTTLEKIQQRKKQMDNLSRLLLSERVLHGNPFL